MTANLSENLIDFFPRGSDLNGIASIASRQSDISERRVLVTEAEFLAATVCEYKAALAEIGSSETPDMNTLARRLSSAHDWSDEGARTIVRLANEYGTFMLHNALALAIALDKEDGDLGF
jgi:hypothetical protein